MYSKDLTMRNSFVAHISLNTIELESRERGKTKQRHVGAKRVTYGGSSVLLEPGNWSQVCAMTLLIGECKKDLPCQHPGLSPLLCWL
ncbi:unnamed protein product [Boreogadus saida]